MRTLQALVNLSHLSGEVTQKKEGDQGVTDEFICSGIPVRDSWCWRRIGHDLLDEHEAANHPWRHDVEVVRGAVLEPALDVVLFPGRCGLPMVRAEAGHVMHSASRYGATPNGATSLAPYGGRPALRRRLAVQYSG